MNTLTVNDIYSLLSSLDKDNKKWLADRLLDDVSKETETEKSSHLAYPKIPKDFEVSDSIKNLVIKSLPDSFDFEAETDKMWEEMAK